MELNRRMVPVIRDTKTEYLNSDPINFISADEVEDGNDDKLPSISYNDAIDTIEHANDIRDQNILIKKTLLLPQD